MEILPTLAGLLAVLSALGALQSLLWLRGRSTRYVVTADDFIGYRGERQIAQVPLDDIRWVGFQLAGTTLLRTLFGHGWLPPRVHVIRKNGRLVEFPPVLVDKRTAQWFESTLVSLARS